MATRVLIVNHTAELAGAERSLLDLVGGLVPPFEPLVACPEGELATALRERATDVVPIPAFGASFRLHALQSSRGVLSIGRAAMRIRSIARERRVDVVHANTERAGLAAALARRFGAPPTVVHTRNRIPESRLGNATVRAIASGADAVVANSRHTADRFPPGATPISVVANALDTERFDPSRIERGAARREFGLEPDEFALAMVGYIAPVKAQDDALRIVARLRDDGLRARLLLAGSVRFTSSGARVDNEAFARELRTIAAALGIADSVAFLGERDDVPEILRASDLLLLPSLSEGFGRTALEAMAMGLPVVATSAGGPAETVRDGVDGILLPPRMPERWAEVVAELAASPGTRERMGASGRTRAVEEFGIAAQAARIGAIYASVLER